MTATFTRELSHTVQDQPFGQVAILRYLGCFVRFMARKR